MSTNSIASVGLGLPVLATWITPYTFYLVYLSAQVSATRRKFKTPIGQTINPVRKDKTPDGKPEPETKLDPRQPDPLYLAIRCHSNYVEVVPWCLSLAAIAELNGADKTVLNIALGVLFVGRMAHVAGMKGKFTAGIGRMVGAGLTLLWLLGMGAYNTWLTKGWWGL